MDGWSVHDVSYVLTDKFDGPRSRVLDRMCVVLFFIFRLVELRVRGSSMERSQSG